MGREIKIGLTVFVALIISYLSITWANRSHFFAGEGITYNIDFQHVGGLLVGDPVHIRGYTMGRVEAIDPRVDRVAVKISLDRNYPLRRGTVAEIQPKELMGGKQIELIQGKDATTLEENSLLQGKTSLDFSSAFSQMGGIMEQFGEERMGQFLNRVDSLLVGVQQIVSSIEANKVSHTVSLLEANLNVLNSLFNEVQERKLVAQVDSILYKVGQTMESTNLRLESVGDIMDSAQQVYLPQVGHTLDSVNQLISQVNGMLRTGEDVLNNPDNVVGKLTQDEAFATQLDSVITRLNRVLLQIEEDKIIVGFKRRKM